MCPRGGAHGGPRTRLALTRSAWTYADDAPSPICACVTIDDGKRRSIGRLMPELLRHKGRKVRMKRSRNRTATLRIAARSTGA